MEKIVPPIKKVPKPDGVRMPSAHTTITTPSPIENKIGFRTGPGSGGETGSMFAKK